MGSGWAALVFDPLTGRLLTCQIYDHQSYLSQTSIPLMVLDAWEHAYYAQYENRKNEFFEAIWNLWNWRDVASCFDQARRASLQLPGASRGRAFQ
jgi:Fe-Mn family superoxide dismutase